MHFNLLSFIFWFIIILAGHNKGIYSDSKNPIGFVCHKNQSVLLICHPNDGNKGKKKDLNIYPSLGKLGLNCFIHVSFESLPVRDRFNKVLTSL